MRDAWRALSMAVVAGLLAADPGGAQESSCPEGWWSADLGFTYRAEIGSIVRAGQDRAWPHLSTEPTVTGVDPGGPAAGEVHEGDAISAIDGIPVTSAEGSRRWGTVQPGDTLRLSLRRNGHLVDGEIVADEECVEKDPGAPSVPDLRGVDRHVTVRTALRNAMTAQEVYHRSRGTYSSSVENLDFQSYDATVEVDHADDHSFVMVATYGDSVWCVSSDDGKVQEGDRCGEEER